MHLPMKLARLSTFLLVAFVFFALGAFRLNNESELTLLMREMFDEAKRVRHAIAAGEEPLFKTDLRAILSAKPSVEAKTNHPDFRPKAEAFLTAADALKSSPIAQRKKAFNNMLDACMACHRTVCPGPMMRIRKLYFKKN